jgi:transcriptional regulator with XRE-family HTH domain
MRTTIGERVRAYRLRRGLTQARLAHLIGRSERWLIDVEAGGVDPRLSDAVALAGVLRVGVDDLVGRVAPVGDRFGRPPPRPPVMLRAVFVEGPGRRLHRRCAGLAYSYAKVMKRGFRRIMGRIGGWLLARAGATGAYGAGLRYLEKGDVAAAALAFADAQRMWLRELGPGHVGVVLAMEKRADCYVRMGRVPEGVRLYERALALDRALRGEETGRVRALTAEIAEARAVLGPPFAGGAEPLATS